MYHTVVIGGGCLGAATAISLQRKLNEIGKGEKVCLLDKALYLCCRIFKAFRNNKIECLTLMLP